MSGLSGSGKTTALHALEDAGYFCVDNLPAPLLPQFLRLVEASPSIQRVAIAMDVRERVLAPDIERDLTGVGSTAGHRLHVLFLAADDEALIARFKTTRRRHPLVAQGAATVLTDAIELERTWLAPLRARATEVLDTTRLNVHDL
ncbi:MAG: RNase adaptor protein RapZ, partial [Myxococcales bacterium]|nr:RNase adaptor protein RapZ [Myxococcales bacterium]